MRSSHHLAHQGVVLPPARPDGVHFFVNVGAVAQQAQPAHQTHILRTQLADGEHPQPTRSKHRQQFQPQGTFLFVRRFRCCGFRLGLVFSSRLGLLLRGSRLHLVFFVLHNYFHPCCFWPRKRRRPARIPQE